MKPFLIRVSIASFKTVGLFWGAVIGLSEFLEKVEDKVGGTASEGLLKLGGDFLGGTITVYLDHPFEMIWGHILAGFLWSLVMDPAKEKQKQVAKKTSKAVKSRRRAGRH